jgi:hypothetical protein
VHPGTEYLVHSSLLPDIDSEVASFVDHDGSESWDDMVSFAEHADSVEEIEMDTCRALAGHRPPVVATGTPDDEIHESNSEEAGYWG